MFIRVPLRILKRIVHVKGFDTAKRNPVWRSSRIQGTARLPTRAARAELAFVTDNASSATSANEEDPMVS